MLKKQSSRTDMCGVARTGVLSQHYCHSHIIEGQFQVFQRFSSSTLVLKTVESCFVALNYYENGSMVHCIVKYADFASIFMSVSLYH